MTHFNVDVHIKCEPTYSIEMYLSLVRNEIDSPILVCSKQRDITDVVDVYI